MSILPQEILLTMKRSMKTKATPLKREKRILPEEDHTAFSVREVSIADEQDTGKGFEAAGVQAELACDVYNLETKVIIVAPIAGAKLDDLRVKIAEDVITIEGERNNPIEADEADIHTAECFWGTFSRSIILPPSADPSKIKASFKSALLVIEIPKIQVPKERVIKIIAG